MSKADWTFLEHLLEEGQEYSTAIGRVWLTVLFLFRMLVLGTAAESAWDDEQATFVCNTKQPGCPAVCYDRAFPISHFRYFILQVIFVSTPTIFYFGYVAIRGGKIHKNAEAKDEKRAAEGGEGRKTGKLSENNTEEKEKERSNGNGTKSIKASPEVPKLKGRLLGVYAFSILLKVLLEAGFIVGLWFLYDGFFIAAKFECTWPPCPHTVDCFVSRPTEKTIFTIYTQVIAAISLVLNLIELLHLLKIALSLRLEKRHQDRLPRLEQVSASQTYGTESHVSPPVRRETASYSAPYDSYADMIVQGNRQPGDAQGDRLPSYANCTSDMRETRSNRCHNTMHLQQTGKNPDSPYKGPQKDYV